MFSVSYIQVYSSLNLPLDRWKEKWRKFYIGRLLLQILSVFSWNGMHVLTILFLLIIVLLHS